MKNNEFLTGKFYLKDKNFIVGYINGLADGTWYQFDKSENLIAAYNFKQGNLNGLQMLFDEEENLKYVAFTQDIPIENIEDLDFHEASDYEKQKAYAHIARVEKTLLKENTFFYSNAFPETKNMLEKISFQEKRVNLDLAQIKSSKVKTRV